MGIYFSERVQFIYRGYRKMGVVCQRVPTIVDIPILSGWAVHDALPMCGQNGVQIILRSQVFGKGRMKSG